MTFRAAVKVKVALSKSFIWSFWLQLRTRTGSDSCFSMEEPKTVPIGDTEGSDASSIRQPAASETGQGNGAEEVWRHVVCVRAMMGLTAPVEISPLG